MRSAQIAAGPPVILCADDYAISPAVSAGIEELAEAGRLSATSCMVTFADWPSLAAGLNRLRPRIAVGLHLNLTAGSPLGPMRHHAPTGALPAIGALITAAARGGIDTAEIEAETGRQLEAFRQHAGFAPDFIDGHQHVHVLPLVRRGVLSALRTFANGKPMLVRDPSDRLVRILRRRLFVTKANAVAALAVRFANGLRAAGFVGNDGFSGYSDFNPTSPYASELEAAFTACGQFHLVMCHPGRADAILATRDHVTSRREEELAVLLAAEGLAERLWRPDRTRADIWDKTDG